MRYTVKAVDDEQRVIALDLDVASEAVARELVRLQGHAVLSVVAHNALLSAVFARPAKFPVALFSSELHALLDAGLNLVEALQTLNDKEPGGETRRVVAEILRTLYEGEPLSRALGRFPQYFSGLYVATVRSSERTGNLKEALARYITYAEELDKLRKKIVSASIYPAILIVVGALVLAFLMFYVVPRFARVYEDISTELPFFSKLLLGIGGLVRDHGPAVVLLLAAGVGLVAYLFAQPRYRAQAAAALWRIPVLGERMKVYQLARFYRTVGMLLRAGIPVVQATGMVSGLLSIHLRERLARAKSLLEEGKTVSTALTSAGLATPVATRMMTVGERSGQMGELMDRIARFHDDEVARFVDTFTRAFEPILMALLGLAVGLIVVLMYMPIFELAGSLQ